MSLKMWCSRDGVPVIIQTGWERGVKYKHSVYWDSWHTVTAGTSIRHRPQLWFKTSCFCKWKQPVRKCCDETVSVQQRVAGSQESLTKNFRPHKSLLSLEENFSAVPRTMKVEDYKSFSLWTNYSVAGIKMRSQTVCKAMLAQYECGLACSIL